jgi:hypothetical protein
MDEQDMPTWNDILVEARASLSSARSSLSDAGGHLRSDWRPAGTALSDGEADARIRAVELIGQAKGLIDRAKGALEGARR